MGGREVLRQARHTAGRFAAFILADLVVSSIVGAILSAAILASLVHP